MFFSLLPYAAFLHEGEAAEEGVPQPEHPGDGLEQAGRVLLLLLLLPGGGGGGPPLPLLHLPHPLSAGKIGGRTTNALGTQPTTHS